MKYTFVFTFLFISFSISAQITQTLKGTILDNESKIPLVGATVYIPGSSPVIGTVSDADGRFRLTVPVGRATIKVSYLGYEEATISEILIMSGKEVNLTIELREAVSALDEVVVKAYNDKIQALNSMASTSVRQLSTEDASRYASGFADPARMVSSFAGVGAVEGDGVNDMVIRGNTPRGLSWKLEGIEIPNPNHFTDGQGATGGALSIISSDVLTNFDFYTGAFPAEYGNAFSGIMDINLRKGNSDKREYALTASVVGMQAASEGPFKKDYRGSYLVNYRYSTLALLNKWGIYDPGDNNLAPIFQDLSLNINLPTEKAGTFGVFAVGGKSSTGTVPVMDKINWQIFDWDTRFDELEEHEMGVAGVKHIYHLANKKTYIKTVVAATHQGDQWESGYLQDSVTRTMQYQDSYFYNSIRANIMLNHKFNPKHTLRGGFIVNKLFANMYQKELDWGTKSYNVLIDKEYESSLSEAYIQWKYRVTDKFEFNTGMHAMYLSLNGSKSLEPRLGMKWTINSKQSVNMGFGIHSKAEAISSYFSLVRLPDGSIGEGNKNIDFTRSFHNVLGYDYAFNENFRLKAEVYYQYINNVPIIDSANSITSALNFSYGVPEIPLKNKGKGYNTGMELTLEKFYSNNYYFLITASLFNSKFSNGGKYYHSTFSNNYIGNVLFGKDFKIRQNTFGINIKALYRGGFRYIPIDIEKSLTKGDEVLDTDQVFTKRFPDYFRGDLGMNYRRNYTGYSWVLSLDIQNFINRKNVLGYEFDTNYNGYIRPVEGSGILPILSFKIEF